MPDRHVPIVLLTTITYILMIPLSWIKCPRSTARGDREDPYYAARPRCPEVDGAGRHLRERPHEAPPPAGSASGAMDGGLPNQGVSAETSRSPFPRPEHGHPAEVPPLELGGLGEARIDFHSPPRPWSSRPRSRPPTPREEEGAGEPAEPSSRPSAKPIPAPSGHGAFRRPGSFRDVPGGGRILRDHRRVQMRMTPHPVRPPANWAGTAIWEGYTSMAATSCGGTAFTGLST